MNLIAVFAENRPGQTALVTKCLAGAGVNIRWVTIANSGSFGVMKFLVDKIEPAEGALRAQGMMVARLPIMAVEVENRPGALHAVAECLAQADLNLDNCSGFVANNRAILIVEARKLEEAERTARAQGLKVLSEEELMGL
jgi:hypothetical protein